MKSSTNKQRLQELAAINNPFLVKEGVDPNFPVKLTINVKAGDLLNMLQEASEEIGSSMPTDPATMDAQEFNRLVKTVQDDLNNWFVQNGVEWFSDGINSDVYADFEG